jgi:hypothetical protein
MEQVLVKPKMLEPIAVQKKAVLSTLLSVDQIETINSGGMVLLMKQTGKKMELGDLVAPMDVIIPISPLQGG